MDLIKTPFLYTAGRYESLGDSGPRYASMLTFVALEPGEIFKRKELAEATHSLSVEGLQAVASTFVRSLEGSGQQRLEYWKNRIHPYLKFIWPKSRDRITDQISTSLAKLCVTAQKAFPQALDVLKYWLRPLNHPDQVVRLLKETDLCSRFPEEALYFFDLVIGQNTRFPPQHLRECLDTIQSSHGALAIDTRYQRLHEYLLRHDRG